MKQFPVQFGKNKEMVGVLALPDQAAPRYKRALLVWNTGISHRVGPHRMNVELAKSLTQIGMPVLRFDLTGRGDSSVREGLPSVLQDVRDAMNMLHEHLGVEEFILHGLCSGAVEAHLVAAADERVVGLSMVDTYAYRVGAYYRCLAWNRLKSWNAWKWAAKKMLRVSQKDAPGGNDQYFMPFPHVSAIRNDFQRFLDRKMPCLVIYTNGYEHVYNYQGQFQDMLEGVDLSPILTEVHHKDADHLYTVVEQREMLLDTVISWVSGRFVDRTVLSDQMTAAYASTIAD